MWQPSVGYCDTWLAPGLWASLTGDLRGQMQISYTPVLMQITLAQMIVAVSVDGQSSWQVLWSTGPPRDSP